MGDHFRIVGEELGITVGYQTAADEEDDHRGEAEGQWQIASLAEEVARLL